MTNSKQNTQHPLLVKQDQYIKETFGLSDEELKQLDKGTYKIPSEPRKQAKKAVI